MLVVKRYGLLSLVMIMAPYMMGADKSQKKITVTEESGGLLEAAISYVSIQKVPQPMTQRQRAFWDTLETFSAQNRKDSDLQALASFVELEPM